MTAAACSPHEAFDAHRTGQALILDVREWSEWRGGHIQGALHIPLGELQARVHEVPRDRKIVCQCASGGRSLAAASFLAQNGFSVCNLSGGIVTWQMVGLPLQRGG